MSRDVLEDRYSTLKSNAETAEAFIDDGNVDAGDITRSISDDLLGIEEGDLTSLERRLAAQSVTLDAIFTRLATQAASALDFGGMEAAERGLKMALKAQQQSANTMKVLIDAKQPKAVFARQANIAQSQLIHSGDQPEAIHARTHGKKNLPQQNRANELEHLEATHHATLDTGITQTPLTIDEKTNT
ncbi:MAG: hypothetical protein ACPGSM_12955 [Thiolinea sp.]